MTDSLIRYATTFESTNNLPMNIEIGHGENADLVASFKDGGIDVDLTGYTARAIFQPKSKWGTDEWYECPCEIVDNTVIAHWGNTYDNGDNAVKLFMHLVKDGKLAYPAIYQISLFSTPGFSPSAIEPIPETIDFAQYQLENAPWVLPDDLSDYATKADATLSATYSDSPRFAEWIPTNYVFTVEWRDNLSSWVFIFNGTIINDDTTEWKDPLATHLESDYGGIGLEANRTRLDVGYVLGSQTDKPLQPMGNYATIDEVDSKTSYTKQIVQTTANNIFYLDNIRSRYVYGVVPNASNSYIGFNNYLTETGKVFDCYIDIDNTTNHSIEIIFGQTSWLYVVDSGVNWNDVKTIPIDTKRRFHISETGIQDTESTNYPVLHVSYTDLVGVNWG